MQTMEDNVSLSVKVARGWQLQNILNIKVIMGRRLLGVFMTVYMPTILMNIIGHSTNYFKHFYFEAAISVNLTVSFNHKTKPLYFLFR